MSIHLGVPKFFHGLDIFRSPEAIGIALKRNSFFAPDRRGERAVGAGGRLGISKDSNPFVELFF